MPCSLCNGLGVTTIDGVELPCSCVIQRSRTPREPDHGFANFGDLVADLRRAAEEREAHQASCTARPCGICEKHVCRCGKPYDGNHGDCEDCRREIRVRFALGKVVATVPKRFKWAAAGDMTTLRARVKLAPERIAKALAEPPDGDLVLIGNTGAGKTSLAVAMLAAAVRQSVTLRDKDRFVSAYAIAGARARHPLGQGEAPEVEKAIAAPLLLLDDIGSESEDRRNVISDIIFARHEADLPTWVTTGFSPEALMLRYGSALIRRLIETKKPVELGAPAAKTGTDG